MAPTQPKKPADTVQSVLAAENEMKRKQAEAAKRRELESTLGRFIQQYGGWLVSAPGAPVLRVEARPGSDLPDRLYDAGFDLMPSGTGQKLWGGKMLPVNCFSFKIPVGK
jgi:hypothetical protein